MPLEKATENDAEYQEETQENELYTVRPRDMIRGALEFSKRPFTPPFS
jgi:hypothetical protein